MNNVLFIILNKIYFLRFYLPIYEINKIIAITNEITFLKETGSLKIFSNYFEPIKIKMKLLQDPKF